MYQKKQGKYRFTDFEIDLAQRTLRRLGHAVTVSTRTFDLLTFFILNPQRSISKEELLEALWPNAEVEESDLRQQMFLLRRALTSTEPGERVIATLPNLGYEFTPAVSKVAEPEEKQPPRRFQPEEDPPGKRPYVNLPTAYRTPRGTQNVRNAIPKAAGESAPEQATTARTDLSPIEPDSNSEAGFQTRSSAIQRLDLVGSKTSEAGPSYDDESGPGISPIEGDSDDQPRRRSQAGEAMDHREYDHDLGGSKRGFAEPGPVQIGLILAFLIFAMGGGWWGWQWNHRIHGDSLHIVVADFENTTGNPDFDQALRTALAIDLRQSPYLEVSTRDRINQTLSNMKLPGNSAQTSELRQDKPRPPKLEFAQLDLKPGFKSGSDLGKVPDPPPPPLLVGTLARDVCRQLKDNAYLTGEIRPFVMKYLVSVDAIDCATGERIAASKGLAQTPDGVLAILDKIAADLRKQLGESPKSIQQFDKPLFAESRNSFEALKAYSAASHLAIENKPREALPLFQRAIELDPRFTMAYADMGAVYSNLGDQENAKASLTKAYGARDGVDEPNRLFITAAYHNVVTHDLNASIRNARQWTEEYPRDPGPLVSLADLETQVGKPALAKDPARRALDLNSNDQAAYVALSRAEIHLNELEEAEKTCQEAIRRKLDNPQIHSLLLQIAFLNLDQAGIDKQIAWAQQQPSGLATPAAQSSKASESADEDSDKTPEQATPPSSPAKAALDRQVAMMDLAQGKVKAAQAVLASLIADDRRQGKIDRANQLQQAIPRIQAELGYPVSALATLTRLREASKPDPKQDGPQPQATESSADIPVAWAEVGETSRAEALLQSALQARPSDTLLGEYQAPQIRAAIALSQHHPQEAIDALEPAHSYDLRSFDALALRAKAYLDAKQFEEAEAEFHKILDHSGVEPLSYNYPLAQFGVARALAAQGKLVEASFAYKIVLQIWKDADADMPRLVQAKAEYAKLNIAPITSSLTAASEGIKPKAKPQSGKASGAKISTSKSRAAKSAAMQLPALIDGIPMKAARPYPTTFPAKLE